MRNLAGWRRLGTAALIATAFLWATNKGPDSGNYSATDSAVYSFVDPAGSGGAASVLANTDDAGALLTLPQGFAFQFYGQSYSVICVSSNGIAYFVSDQSFCNSQAQLSDFANVDLSSTAGPGDLPAIAPFWMDLAFPPAGGGGVYYQTIGTEVGSRQFVIEWYNAYPVHSPTPVTFEVVLFEGSNNILFQYQTVNGSGNPVPNGAAATVGIRNTGGQKNGQGIQWSYDVPVLANASAILFSSPVPVTIQTQPAGLSVVIDGVAASTPVTLYWAPQSPHTLTATSPQVNGGTQYVFSSWSTADQTATINIAAPATAGTFTANFNTQYLLTTSVSPAGEGTITAGGFIAAGQTVSIEASANPTYLFKNFSGDLTGPANPQNLLMNGPKSVVANFGLANPCLLTQDTTVGVADVQAIINQGLGKASPAGDINGDGKVNAIDVQIVINAALKLGCSI